MYQKYAAPLLMGVLFWAWSAVAQNGLVVGNKNFVKVFRSPTVNSRQAGFLRTAEHYKILSTKGEWVGVDFNGITGWVNASDISTVAATPTANSPTKDSDAIEIPLLEQTHDADDSVEVQNDASGISSSSSLTQKSAIKSESGDSRNQGVLKTSTGARGGTNSSYAVKRASENLVPRSLQGTRIDSNNSLKPTPKKTSLGFFEIMEGPAKVLKTLNPQSPLLGFAYKNESYPLVSIGELWCKIGFKGDTGWIEIARGNIVDSPPVSQKIPGFVFIILISSGVLIVLIITIIFIVAGARVKKYKNISLKREVLIISRTEKHIHYSLTNSATTISKCFTEIGFQVNTASDLDQIKTMLLHYVPDIVMVDWQLEENVYSSVVSILSDRTRSASIHVIFYNVPDPTELSQATRSNTLYFLGLVFSDRDIFKIVTPLLVTEKSTRKTFKKSVQHSALEGEIHDGSLVEVLQFIEIGKKTGCLYVTLSTPFALVYFEQGRITYAASPESQGRKAIIELLNLNEGHFQFVQDKYSKTKNVNLSTLEVLMDWSKVKDEMHRH